MDNGVVLIIEADEDICRFFEEKILKPLGYKILSARNEKQGLELALLNSPDLILLGESLAGMPELKFLSVLAQSVNNSPVVMLTTNASKDDLLAAFQRGMSDYIALPARFDTARETIKRMIDNGNARNQREESNHRLLRVEAVQITMITLSHYINNYLTALDGNLTLLAEYIQQGKGIASLVEIVEHSQTNLSCIEMVLQILLNTTSVSFTKYDDTTQMIDIHDEMINELKRIEKKR